MSGSATEQAPAADALAHVNGVPVTRAELYADSPANVDDQAFLVAVVQKELAAQRALGLGLASDATYAEALRQKEAELTAWKRRELASLYFRREVQAKAVVSDEEARAYYEAHRDRIRTELHLLQIFMRDRTRIDAAHRALEEGRPFEDVARAELPNLPPSSTPWDLGFQRYGQMPDAWLDVAYALKDGEHSAVIAGPNQRYWILALVERRQGDVSFEQARDTIRTRLEADKLETLRKTAEQELFKGAKVVFTKREAHAQAP